MKIAKSMNSALKKWNKKYVSKIKLFTIITFTIKTLRPKLNAVSFKNEQWGFFSSFTHRRLKSDGCILKLYVASEHFFLARAIMSSGILAILTWQLGEKKQYGSLIIANFKNCIKSYTCNFERLFLTTLMSSFTRFICSFSSDASWRMFSISLRTLMGEQQLSKIVIYNVEHFSNELPSNHDQLKAFVWLYKLNWELNYI